MISTEAFQLSKESKGWHGVMQPFIEWGKSLVCHISYCHAVIQTSQKSISLNSFEIARSNPREELNLYDRAFCILRLRSDRAMNSFTPPRFALSKPGCTSFTDCPNGVLRMWGTRFLKSTSVGEWTRGMEWVVSVGLLSEASCRWSHRTQGVCANPKRLNVAIGEWRELQSTVEFWSARVLSACSRAFESK